MSFLLRDHLLCNLGPVGKAQVSYQPLLVATFLTGQHQSGCINRQVVMNTPVLADGVSSSKDLSTSATSLFKQGCTLTLSLSQETTCENENGKSKCTHASAWQPPSTPKRIQNQKAKYNATKTGQNQRKVTASSYSYSYLHSNQRKASSFPIGRVSVSACQLNRSSRFPNSERVGLTSIHRIRGEAAQRRTNNLVLYNCKHRDREMLSEIKTHERGFMGIAGLQGKRRTTGGGGKSTRVPASFLTLTPSEASYSKIFE